MKISKRKYAALMRVLRNLPARLYEECRYTPRERNAVREARLHSIEGLAMVSSYDCELTNRLYADWHKVKFPFKRNNIRSGIVNGSGTLMQECIWMNYRPETQIMELF